MTPIEKTIVVKLSLWELQQIRIKLQQGPQDPDARELVLKIIAAEDRCEAKNL